MRSLLDILGRQSSPVILALGIALIFFIGAFDYLSGPEVSSSLFFLLPVLLVTWFTRLRWGLLVCLLCSLAWLYADLASSRVYSHPLIPYFNAVIRLGIFVIVAVLADVRLLVERERENARIDFLTGVANARFFHEAAERESKRSSRSRLPLTMAYMDLDDFKLINDEYGHSLGDKLLKEVACSIQGGLRATDLTARLGGDEFAVLLPDTSYEASQVAMSKVQERLLDLVSGNYPITFSIGVVTFSQPPASVDEMIRAVDGVMYQVKHRGKNGILFVEQPPTKQETSLKEAV